MPDNLKRILLDGDVLAYRSSGGVKEDEPVANALHNAKNGINRVRDRFPGVEVIPYLSGPNNFRYEVAKTQPYKGNRTQPKPIYLGDVRDYLLERHRAIIIDGREADDGMGCEQWAAKDRSTLIATNDKDLKMIPGWHYNPWSKDGAEPFYVKLTDANHWFYKQMLMGDRTDNIRGIPGLGPAAADRMLMGYRGSDTDCGGVVRKAYQQEYGDRWREVMEEHAALLWIQRQENERTDLPL